MSTASPIATKSISSTKLALAFLFLGAAAAAAAGVTRHISPDLSVIKSTIMVEDIGGSVDTVSGKYITASVPNAGGQMPFSFTIYATNATTPMTIPVLIQFQNPTNGTLYRPTYSLDSATTVQGESISDTVDNDVWLELNAVDFSQSSARTISGVADLGALFTSYPAAKAVRIVVTIDPTNTISESSKSNNTFTYTITRNAPIHVVEEPGVCIEDSNHLSSFLLDAGDTSLGSSVTPLAADSAEVAAERMPITMNGSVECLSENCQQNIYAIGDYVFIQQYYTTGEYAVKMFNDYYNPAGLLSSNFFTGQFYAMFGALPTIDTKAPSFGDQSVCFGVTVNKDIRNYDASVYCGFRYKNYLVFAGGPQPYNDGTVRQALWNAMNSIVGKMQGADAQCGKMVPVVSNTNTSEPTGGIITNDNPIVTDAGINTTTGDTSSSASNETNTGSNSGNVPVTSGSSGGSSGGSSAGSSGGSGGGSSGGGGGGGAAPAAAAPTVTLPASSASAGTQKPTSAVLFNAGKSTVDSQNVTLTLPETNGDQMALSNVADFAGVSWQTYKKIVAWKLTSGYGTKTVYVKFRNSKTGGVTGVYSGTVEYAKAAAAKSTPITATPCAVTPGKAYQQPPNKAVYYITDKCTKRPFKNPAVFFTYFTSWSEVLTTNSLPPDDAIGFMPWGPKYNPKSGALVKVVDDSKVYLLLNGKKYWITSETVFLGLGYQWNWVEDADAALLNAFETVGEISSTKTHPDGTVFKYGGNPKVYVLEAGKKRWIVNEAAFNTLGYRWDRIVTIPSSEVYPDGVDLK